MILQSLRDKGLIERQTKGKRYLYSAKDPETLMANLDNQKSTLTQMLPDLRALYKSQKNKPTVKFLYGIEEIKEQFLTPVASDEILFVAPTNTLFETYPSEFKKYRKKLAKDDVFVRDILTQESGIKIAQKTSKAMGVHYEYRLFEAKYEDLPTTIRIWENNVALVTFDENPFGTVITSEPLARTFKIMFETMWKAGKSE